MAAKVRGGGKSRPDALRCCSMGRSVLRILRVGAGIGCLVLGAAGLFLPFLQGILLLVAGLTLLSRESEWARSCLQWLRGRLRLKQQLERGD